MNAILSHTRGLRLLLNVNGDRLLYIALLLFALAFGAWVGTVGF